MLSLEKKNACASFYLGSSKDAGGGADHGGAAADTSGKSKDENVGAKQPEICGSDIFINVVNQK